MIVIYLGSFNDNGRKYYLFAKTPLLECKRVSFVETKKVYSYEEAMSHFQEILQRGEEGTILKAPMATWKDGKPFISVIGTVKPSMPKLLVVKLSVINVDESTV